MLLCILFPITVIVFKGPYPCRGEVVSPPPSTWPGSTSCQRACRPSFSSEATSNQFSPSTHKRLTAPNRSHLGVNAQGATSDKFVACRVTSNYPFAKLMEIAESVATHRTRVTSDKIFQATKFQIFIISCVRCCDKRQFFCWERCRSLCVHTLCLSLEHLSCLSF